jgi:SAM-dependent methyltransferase
MRHLTEGTPAIFAEDAPAGSSTGRPGRRREELVTDRAIAWATVAATGSHDRTRLERTSIRYAAHHRDVGRSRAFLFGYGARASLMKALIQGPGLKILDLGCRYGALTQAYLDGNTVVGLDIDREALEQAAALGITTVWADVEEPLPFASGSFDVVVAGELLEHLSDPHFAVAEAHRVLAPDGAFVGSVPNAYRLKNRVRFALGRPPDDDATHLQLFSPMDVDGLLADFRDTELHLVVGRFTHLHPRLLANTIVFFGRKQANETRGGPLLVSASA